MVLKAKQGKLIYCCFVFIMVLFAMTFWVDTNDNMDFVRYQELMDRVRYSKVSFYNFVIKGEYTGTVNHILKYQYGFNLLLFLVAKATSNYYLLPWISVLIDYAMVAYIAYDFGKDNPYKPIHVMLMALLCFALMPFIHACSGMRMATAVCIMAVGVYQFLYRNRSWFLFAVFCMLAVSFHLSVLFAIPVAILVRLINKKVIIFIVTFGTLFASRVAALLRLSSNDLLRRIGIKYQTYTAENQFRAYRFCLYGAILLSVIIIAYYLFIYQDSWKSNRSRLYTFIASYMGLLLGNIGSYELVVRNAYLLGAMAPILSVMVLEKREGPNKELAMVFQIAVIALAAFMAFMYIYHYHQFFTFGAYRFFLGDLR